MKILTDQEDLVQLHTYIPRVFKDMLKERALASRRTLTQEIFLCFQYILENDINLKS